MRIKTAILLYNTVLGIEFFYHFPPSCWEEASSNRRTLHGRQGHILAQTDSFNPFPSPVSLNNNLPASLQYKEGEG